MPIPPVEPRDAPERIVLGVRGDATPSGLPPVRIFLGTEPAQSRAERVFVWSIERHRDPSRVYEIHLMGGLSGFRCRGWTTGFTNHRFAIPHFAGGEGRAVYNDVDQIYLSDPAELFDRDLGGHGYLAVAEDDTSVMLLDCERMGAVWSLAAARTGAKRDLHRRAKREPGLYGSLPPEWNARDGEFVAGRSRLLHYTTLHTQPWRPFPDRFVYQENPRAEVWREYERSADAAGFQVFSRERPSEAFCRRGLRADAPLDAVPDADLPWVLDERARHGDVRASVSCAPSPRPLRALGARGRERRTPGWWDEQLEAAATRHPRRRFELELSVPAAGGGSRREERAAGALPEGRLPNVWVLADDRGGNTSQSLGLAAELAWPTEVKPLTPRWLSILSNRLLGASRAGMREAAASPLAPPWPDLVITAGRRNAPVALWIRAQSRGRTRLVMLGRKSGDAADLFDLAVTPAYARLFPHPRRVVTAAPLHVVNASRLAEAAERWKERVEGLPSPRIALLVGGTSGQYRFDAATASRLGEDVARLAKEAGGSVLVTTSRRTGEPQTAALRAALPDAAHFHAWRPEDPDNPYLAYLALADTFVVTGDSESMLAEVADLSRPVAIYPLPVRRSFRFMALPRGWIDARARATPAGPRGTPRPQRGLEHLCARLIDRGFVRTVRDLAVLHEDLVQRGFARRFGEPDRAGSSAPMRDLPAVAARVRAMMSVG